MARTWWQGAVGYEIYVPSFADAGGDGLGDLEGIRRRLDHVVALGVDLIWLTPFYPSPLADHGYDVSDYTDVDPRFGTLADLDRLVADAHQRGLRVICDLVPNHSSDHHPWFQAALAGDPAYRDFYVWRDGVGDGPPNNWISHFGGPAWTFRPEVDKWYMHLFLPEQPDLNWANPAVAEAFDQILEFWFSRGVDGLRIDVAHSLVEDPSFADNPVLDPVAATSPDPREAMTAYEHRYDMDQPGVIEIFQRWREIADRHGAWLLGEVYLLETPRLARYLTGEGLHASFCFPAIKVAWDAAELRTTLAEAVAVGGDALCWPLASHDDPRAPTRFGGGERGRERALAYLTLLCALPGVPFLLAGDELGLEDGTGLVAEDPLAVRNVDSRGRDGSRTPLPWEPGSGFGFTTAPEPWLGFGKNRTALDTVTVQRADPASHLSRTVALLALRRSLEDLRRPVDACPLRWLDASADVVAVQRGSVVAVLNAGTTPVELGPFGGRPRFSSRTGRGGDGAAATLAPDEAVLLVRDDD